MMGAWQLADMLAHVCLLASAMLLLPPGLPTIALSYCTLQGSPRSGSGSERSTGSAPLYVERRRVPGMLQASEAG